MKRACSTTTEEFVTHKKQRTDCGSSIHEENNITINRNIEKDFANESKRETNHGFLFEFDSDDSREHLANALPSPPEPLEIVDTSKSTTSDIKNLYKKSMLNPIVNLLGEKYPITKSNLCNNNQCSSHTSQLHDLTIPIQTNLKPISIKKIQNHDTTTTNRALQQHTPLMLTSQRKTKNRNPNNLALKQTHPPKKPELGLFEKIPNTENVIPNTNSNNCTFCSKDISDIVNTYKSSNGEIDYEGLSKVLFCCYMCRKPSHIGCIIGTLVISKDGQFGNYGKLCEIVCTCGFSYSNLKFYDVASVQYMNAKRFKDYTFSMNSKVANAIKEKRIVSNDGKFDYNTMVNPALFQSVWFKYCK